jgi:hypothetical protein
MQRLSASLLLLFAATFTMAQTSSNPPNAPRNLPAKASIKGQTSGILAEVVNSNLGCPVGFSASRQATGQIMSIGDTRQAGPALGLHLMLNHLGSTPGIQSVEVTVYGASPKGLYLPAGAPSPNTVSKTFELHRTAEDTTLSEADVWMHRVGSLSWADLISITYVDGTTWHATENLKCRAVPSNLLLVGSR